MKLSVSSAILLTLSSASLLPAVEREWIDVLLPVAKVSHKRVSVKSARVDWWTVPDPSKASLVPASEAPASPIVVVLDFLHTPNERSECLMEEILPVLEDPAYRGRLRVLALGGPKPYFQELRGRYRTFQILDPRQIDAARIHEACRVPSPAVASAAAKADLLVRLARALGYSTANLVGNWNRFDSSRSGMREVVDEIPAKGAPARIFWLAEDFRPFDGPPNGCDLGESENQTSVALGGNCLSGGLVDRDLLYFYLSGITHAGAVITPVLMMHHDLDPALRDRSRAAAARMARYTGAPLVVADQHPSRALWAAIRESDRWPVASLAVPVVGMRAVITQPRKLSVTLSDGTRVERRFATKEGQMVVDNLYSELTQNQPRGVQRFAGSNPMPMGSVMPVAPTAQAVVVSGGAGSPRPAWLLPRRLNVQVESGCGQIASRTPGGHALMMVKVPETEWNGQGPVEVILRGKGVFAQSLTATREELQSGVCFGVPAGDAKGGFQLLVVDPEAGAGGVFGN